MVESITEELCLVEPEAKRQRMNSGDAGAFTAGEHVSSKGGRCTAANH
jgi:hypothetical protein